jgi:gliding motility-associated-like protein
MKRYRIVLLSLLFAVSYCSVQAQGYSNKGRDFWITYPFHIDGLNSAMGIYITSDVAATGTITVGAQTIPFTLTANSVVRKFFNNNPTTGDGSNLDVHQSQQDGVTANSAIHIVSDNPVAVYAHIINNSRSGASLILPSPVWGKHYIVPSYRNLGSQPAGVLYGYGAITVVAAEANTTVQITPAVNTLSGKGSGTPYQVTLASPGDVYQVQFQQNADISGTIVQSVAGNGGACKRIAVFSSTSWSAFGCAGSSSGDNLYQQLFPTASWGKNFLAVPAKTRTLDIFRVFVSDPSAVVTKTENGVVSTLTGLQNNSFYEYTTGNPTFIKADKQVSVVQYFTTMACQAGSTFGDPEMVVLNPVEQTINDITVFSAHKNWIPKKSATVDQSNVDHCYLNIVIKTNSVSSFKINGSAPAGSFTVVPGTDFSYLQEDVSTIAATNPVQTLTADSSFSAIAYGFGPVESYGYNAGTNVKDFSQLAAFQNQYRRIDSAVTCVNSPFQFSVPLAFQPQTIRWDFSAASNITPNATISMSPAAAYDSTSGPVYFYSPHSSFTFTKANNAQQRDTIKLYTTSATPDGCGSTDQLFTIPVKVLDLPVADFTITHNGCISDSLKLADQSVYAGTLAEWRWDFGDGSTETRSSSALFAKKYSTAGSYAVKLKLISDIGCSSADKSVPVQVSEKPIAKFNLPNVLCPETDITYTDISTTTDKPIMKWIWVLDDGSAPFTNTTNAPVTTKYSTPGTKYVTLIVEDSIGCKSDSYTRVATINVLPAAGFMLPEICLDDANAQFTDTSTITEGTIASYNWSFNAGTPAVSPGPSVSTSTAKNPQVTYKAADHYKVSLTLTSDKGCITTRVQDFTVNGVTPKAAFDMVNPAPYCGIKPVQVQNNSTVDFGEVTKLEIYWDNTGQPSVKQTDETPVRGKKYSYAYPDPSAPRQYTIRMVAYSGGSSCVNETTRTITVYPQPKAGFSMSAAQICSDASVTYKDQSTTGSSAGASWVWDLGKNSVSNLQNPVKQYSDSGIMTVSMYFTNADGCISDTVSKTLTIYPNPKLGLEPQQKVLDGGVITLRPSWVYGNNLSYRWAPPTWLSSDTTVETKSTPQNDITYTLSVTGEGGCVATAAVFLRVLKGPEVPNAFSPNRDGINDTWAIKYLSDYPDATIEVYNRYGQVVFRSVGYDKNWDGTYQGNPLAVGTYYYIINPRNGKKVITGAVTIIK